MFSAFSWLISPDAGELSFTFELFNGATKIDPGSTTAIKLKTDLTGKLTVSESGFLASKFTVFFVSVKADKDNPVTQRHRPL